MADWSLLQTPNFAAAALGGYQAGAALGKQKRLDTALQGFDLSRPETYGPLIAADPVSGSAVVEAGTKLLALQHTAALGNAMADVIRKHAGLPGAASAGAPPALGGGSYDAPTSTLPALGGAVPPPAFASGTIPGTDNSLTSGGPPAATDASPQATGDDILVTARKEGPTTTPAQDYAEGIAHLAQYATPEQLTSAVDMLGKMDKATQDQMTDATGTLAIVGQKAKTLPYERRAAFIQKFTPMLLQHHLTPQQIAAFDPTDDNIDVQIGQAQGIEKTVAAQQRAAEMAETHRHNTVEEGQGQQRVGVEAQNAATSRGQLGVAQQRLGLAKTVAGASGVSTSSTPDLVAIARGQKSAPRPSAGDIFAIAGER